MVRYLPHIHPCFRLIAWTGVLQLQRYNILNAHTRLRSRLPVTLPSFAISSDWSVKAMAMAGRCTLSKQLTSDGVEAERFTLTLTVNVDVGRLKKQKHAG